MENFLQLMVTGDLQSLQVDGPKEADHPPRIVYMRSLPLSVSWLAVPLLCITLASSTSGWGAGASPGAAGASHTDGGPALVL